MVVQAVGLVVAVAVLEKRVATEHNLVELAEKAATD